MLDKIKIQTTIAIYSRIMPIYTEDISASLSTNRCINLYFHFVFKNFLFLITTLVILKPNVVKDLFKIQINFDSLIFCWRFLRERWLSLLLIIYKKHVSFGAVIAQYLIPSFIYFIEQPKCLEGENVTSSANIIRRWHLALTHTQK